MKNAQTHILIVDDDEPLREYLLYWLKKSGYACHAVPDGLQAIEVFRQTDIDVALLDLNMPKMDGLHLLEKMQEMGAQAIPVVLTGRGNVSDAVQAMKLGAFDFIEKPCDTRIIQGVINRASAYRNALRQTEEMQIVAEKWQDIFNASPDLLIATDLNALVVHCNLAAAAHAGMEPDQMNGLSCHEVFCRQPHGESPCPFDEMRTATPNTHNTRAVRDCYFDITFSRLRNRGGDEDWGMLLCMRDITARSASEHALRESEKWHKALFTNSHDAIMTLDLSSMTFSSCNPACLVMFGCTDEAQFKTLHPWDLSPETQPDGEASSQKAQEIIQVAIRKGRICTEWLHLRYGGEFQGETFHAMVYLNRVELDGRAFILATVRDISEQENAILSMQEEKEKLNTITQSAQDAILMMDPEGRISFFNHAAEAIFGWPAHSMMGKKLHEHLMPSQYASRFENGFAHFQATGDGPVLGRTVTMNARRKDGTEVPVELSVSRVLLQGQWHAVGIIRDISQRLFDEQALRASEEKFRQIVDNIGLGVAVITPDMRIVEMNRQMRAWFPDVRLKEEPVCYQTTGNPALNEICTNCPTRLTLKDGLVHEAVVSPGPDQRKFRVVSSPIHGVQGTVIGAIEMVEDISDKLRMEAELQQAQKLEAVGSLAAGIAHEINTPTQYIGDNVDFLQMAFDVIQGFLAAYRNLLDVASGGTVPQQMIEEARELIESTNLPYLEEQIPKAIEQSLEGILRVSTIVQAMKEFSHPGTGEKSFSDLNRCIRSTATVSHNEWKYVARLEMDLDNNLPFISCLPWEINQVILNLIVNASHAIADVAAENPAHEGLIQIRTRHADEFVEISISDNGTGIPSEVHNRIFDPFFTTKEVGKGTGQGLSIARNVIVDKHGGTISILDSVVGEGTTFLIRLPIGK